MKFPSEVVRRSVSQLSDAAQKNILVRGQGEQMRFFI